MEFWICGQSDLSVLISRQMRVVKGVWRRALRSPCRNLAYKREPQPHIQEWPFTGDERYSDSEDHRSYSDYKSYSVDNKERRRYQGQCR